MIWLPCFFPFVCDIFFYCWKKLECCVTLAIYSWWMLKWLTPIKCIETTNFKLTSSVIVAANISEYILNLCIILTLYNNVNWFLSSNHWFQVGKLLHGMKRFFDSFTQRSKNFSLLIAFWQWMSWQFACIMQRRCRIYTL